MYYVLSKHQNIMYLLPFALRKWKWKWGQKINIDRENNLLVYLHNKETEGRTITEVMTLFILLRVFFCNSLTYCPTTGGKTRSNAERKCNIFCTEFIISGRSCHLRSIGLFFLSPRVAIFSKLKTYPSLMISFRVDNVDGMNLKTTHTGS